MIQTNHNARKLAMLAAVALAVTTLAAPAMAEQDAPPPAHEGRMAPDTTPVSDADIAAAKAEHEKVKAMSPEDRRAYFEQRKAEMEKLSPEERRAKHRARKAYFDSLPQEEKDAMKAEREKRRAERKAEWEKMTPEEKAAKKAEMKERFDKLPPEQQEKIKARRAEHREHMQQGDGPRGHGKNDMAQPPMQDDVMLDEAAPE